MKVTVELILDTTCTSQELAHNPRTTTFKITMPKYLVAEFNTHRALSRNSFSSRAVPSDKAADYAYSNMFMPDKWLENQAGMQAKSTELPYFKKLLATLIWKSTAKVCVWSSKSLFKLGLHKQWSGRMLEWFMPTIIIATATDWQNFIMLRNHPSAQPEIQEVAKQIERLLKDSFPHCLKVGQWHIPFIDTHHGDYFGYYLNGLSIDTETALKISASICAQISYRKSDTSLEKALSIYNRLIESEPKHLSPFEHQAYYASSEEYSVDFQGNLRYAHQYRKYIEHGVMPL